jgi:hypothetical protein
VSEDRIHRTVSADGTEIAGRVHGHGPPLVLAHGDPHDGDLAWAALVPHLTDRFTCYLPSTRGRGLSGDNTDHSPPRLHEDVTAFVDSIGEPVRLLGWSGADTALSAAAHGGAVAAVAAFEPGVLSVMRENDLAHMGATFDKVGEAVADGRFVDAARAFHSWVCTHDEIAALDADYFERCAAIVPAMMQDAQQAMGYKGALPSDPEVLGKITVPFLLLRGQQTLLDTFFADSAQHIAQLVADPHVREPLPSVGHFAPVVAPKPLAKELIVFFSSVWRP